MLLPLLGIIAEILPIVLYLCFVRRNKHKGLWVIFLYCLVSFFTETVLLYVRGVPNGEFYMLSSFTVLEYSLFTIFFFLSFSEKKFKYIAILGSLIFFAIATINFIDKRPATFDSLSASAEAVLIILYSIFFLYEQIQNPDVVYVYNSKKFWIIIAFFIYFSSTLFLFIYASTLTKQEHSYWDINSFFDIIKNLLFCIAFVKKQDKKPEYPIGKIYSDI